jgi:hypothetical protein
MRSRDTDRGSVDAFACALFIYLFIYIFIAGYARATLVSRGCTPLGKMPLRRNRAARRADSLRNADNVSALITVGKSAGPAVPFARETRIQDDRKVTKLKRLRGTARCMHMAATRRRIFMAMRE